MAVVSASEVVILCYPNASPSYNRCCNRNNILRSEYIIVFADKFYVVYNVNAKEIKGKVNIETILVDLIPVLPILK
jgi:hypothetical protein